MILYEDFLRKKSKEKLGKFVALTESCKFEVDKQYDIFISHSIKDKELIDGLAIALEEAGYTFFIDWKEDEFKNRADVSRETARRLKEYMDNCTSLVYVSTENTSLSRWCPWELGYVDGKKNKVAILPILKEIQGNEYEGEEYLGIYPYVRYTLIQDKKEYDFWVKDVGIDSQPLRNWLERK